MPARWGAQVGYELNGNSLLYGNFIATPAVTQSSLPSRFFVCCRRECCGHDTGNVLIKLNDSGLRAKVVPLAGISYTF